MSEKKKEKPKSPTAESKEEKKKTPEKPVEPASAPAEAKEEKPEEKPEKKEKKAEKKKKKDKKIHTLYKVENGKLTRLQPFCERCGQGYFMADHGDRYSCGHCGFTRYKHAATST